MKKPVPSSPRQGLFLPWFPLLLILCFGSGTYAQAPLSVRVSSTGGLPGACLGHEVLVPFTTTLRLGGTNQFQVLITSKSSASRTQLRPATRVGNSLRVTFERGVFDAADFSAGFDLRIATTDPQAQSERVSFFLYPPPTVRLASAEVTGAQPFDPVPLSLSAETHALTTITFSDSSQTTLGNQAGSYGYVAGGLTVYPARDQTYRIVRAENACGAGTVSGSVSVRTTPLAIRPIAVSPQRVCAGESIYVQYSTLGTFRPGNRFKIRLTRLQVGNSSLESQERIDLDASVENGVLKAPLPVSFPTRFTTNDFSVRILASDPEVVSTNPNRVLVTVADAPSASLVVEEPNVSFGQATRLRIDFKGVPPFSATLNDGVTYRFGEQDSRWVSVLGETTKAFAITQFSTGCVNQPAADPRPVTLNVAPGVRIDSLPTWVCEGSEARFRIRTSVAIPDGTPVRVELHKGSGLFATLAGVKRGDYVTCPTTGLPFTGEVNEQRFFTPRLVFPMISTELPRTSTFVIQGRPTGRTFPETIPFPRKTEYRMGFSGGGPYDVELETDLGRMTATVHNNINPPVFPLRTQSFRILSVRNACFSNETPSAPATITVAEPGTRGIEVQSARTAHCVREGIAVQFRSVGTFEAGNVFRIEVSPTDFNGSGPVTVQVPDARPTAPFVLVPGVESQPFQRTFLRVVSTKPEVISNSVEIRLADLPTALFDLNAMTANATTLPGESGNVAVILNGRGPYTLSYRTGTTERTESIPATSDGAQPALLARPSQATRYELLQIRNACGTRALTEAYSYAPGYRLQIRSTPTACAGASLAVPYQALGAPTDERFNLQLAPQRDTVFRDLVSDVRGNPAVALLPADLPEGYYRLRLVGSRGIRSNVLEIYLNQPATARVSLAGTTASTVTLASLTDQARIDLTFTGTQPWQTIFQDSTARTDDRSPALWLASPARNRTYIAQTVVNACGYGSASGSVEVRIEPTVAIRHTVAPLPGVGGFCPGQILRVDLLTRGTFGAENRLRLGLRGPNYPVRWQVLNAPALRYEFRLPTDLPEGVYELVLESSHPEKQAVLSLSVLGRSTFTLMGSATINAGQETYLLLSRTAVSQSADYLDYTLSDGTSGQFFDNQSLVFIPVKPTQTTTYTLTSLANQCGASPGMGSALVAVNAPADREVRIRDLLPGPLCSGQFITLDYEAKGTFSATNRFTIQISDSTGRVFSSLSTTTGAGTRLAATLPTTLPSGNLYRLRVVASDAGTASSDWPYPILIRQPATARFNQDVLLAAPNQAAVWEVILTGTPPWQVWLNGESTPQSFLQAVRRFTLPPGFKPQEFTIDRVQNVCGIGQVLTPGTLRVELLTATELPPGTQARVFPNPTTSRVRIEWEPAGPFRWTLTDLQGRVLAKFQGDGPATEVDVSAQPAGTYLLRLARAGTQAVYRLVRR